jgi:uncharacterized membrane protein YeiH
MHSAVEYVTLGVAACAGALAAQGKRIDLFGVLVMALVATFGGGTVRDLCLDAPVGWLRSPNLVWTAILSTLITFVLAQRFRFPTKAIDYVDALSLALYSILGTKKAAEFGVSAVAAVSLGTVTGVAGGILRDILLNVVPGVFLTSQRLYATAAIVGCSVYLTMRHFGAPESLSFSIGATIIFAMRLAAIHFPLVLPEFEEPPNEK